MHSQPQLHLKEKGGSDAARLIGPSTDTQTYFGRLPGHLIELLSLTHYTKLGGDGHCKPVTTKDLTNWKVKQTTSHLCINGLAYFVMVCVSWSWCFRAQLSGMRNFLDPPPFTVSVGATLNTQNTR